MRVLASVKRGYATIRWRRWAPATFEEAQRENKCVFVSSVSHSQWCERMAAEAFADAANGAALNTRFVPVRIEKDEERGIDKALMMFLQLKAGGQGGWPLNAVLTPTQRAPFLAASYLSSADLGRFLTAAESAWRATPALCEQAASSAVAELAQIRDAAPGSQDQLDARDAREQAALQYKALATQAPRFVMGYALSVLGGELCRDVLHAIARGGVVDHLDGGVYAYSVSSDWHLPSFHKTLSGQATLLMACAARLREDPEDDVVRGLAEGLVAYTAALAPFTAETCAAHLWAYDEFAASLGPHLSRVERDVAQAMWGVNDGGNVNPELDPLRECDGLNVLSLHMPAEEAATTFGVSRADAARAFARSRELLRAYRREHKAPPQGAVSERVVISDLGLALSGLAQIAAFVPAARAHAAALAQQLEGVPAVSAPGARTCDEFAFTVMGLLDFHAHVAADARWARAAAAWQRAQNRLFADPHSGGFFYALDVPDLFFRPKFTYDGAEPNYNGVSARNLERLARLPPADTGDNPSDAGDAGDAASATTPLRVRNVGAHGVLSSPLAHLSYL